jgi:hypothetical protein
MAAMQSLRERLREVGRELAGREVEHREALEAARAKAESVRAEVAQALAGFREALDEVGAPQLAVELGEIRTDDKHVRAVEFELRRGRHRAIVTVKSRGEVTLVGPFHAGKTEGPCKSFPFGADDEIRRALGEFVERFVRDAATP